MVTTAAILIVLSLVCLFSTAGSSGGPFLYIRNDEASLSAASPRFNIDIWARVDESNDYDFTVFENRYICVNMLDEVKDCRKLTKVISTYTLVNTVAYGHVSFKFLLLAPAIPSNTTKIDLYVIPEANGTFQLLEDNNVSIEIVPHDEGIKKLRSYLALQGPLSPHPSTDILEQYPLTTVTVVACDGLDESMKNFSLALGAADMRVVVPETGLEICKKSLGMHIACCEFGKD
jgi:hypothetical protein